jgi:hypothetical protein
MINGEIFDDRFIGKTDAQILRELAATWGHPGFVLPDEQFEQPIELAVWPDDETVSPTH